MRFSKLLLAATAAGALAVAPAAVAKTRTVNPGESIQAAINKSEAGDTVQVRKGTYTEALQISKNGIHLRGERATLKQPATSTTFCNQDPEDPGAFTGICVVGELAFPGGEPEVVEPVKRVHVSGFTVRGFGGDGIFVFGAKRTVVHNSEFLRNGGYGAFSNTSTGTRFHHVTARRNGDAGFYIGDAPKANLRLWQNTATGNLGAGVFIRNAQGGIVRTSLLRGNCAGVLLLADAPGPVGNLTIERNSIGRNNKACPPEDEGPAISGVGILLLGAHDITVQNNALLRNRDNNPSIASGGIVVREGFGGTDPLDNLIRTNALTENAPFDLSWDEKGKFIQFKNNQCTTSKPGGLCG